MDIGFDDDNMYTEVLVSDLNEGDVLNLEGDSAWDDEEYGELQNPDHVLIVDVYPESAPDERNPYGTWGIVVLNGAEEQGIILDGSVPVMRLSEE